VIKRLQRKQKRARKSRKECFEEVKALDDLLWCVGSLAKIIADLPNSRVSKPSTPMTNT
jgi:hypothetical protein